MNSTPNMPICCVLVLLGIMFHFLTKLSELEQMGSEMTPWGYWRQYPYQSLLVVAGAFLSLAFMWSIEQVTYASAVLLGIAANSTGDHLRARSEQMQDEALGMITVQHKVFVKDLPTQP